MTFDRFVWFETGSTRTVSRGCCGVGSSGCLGVFPFPFTAALLFLLAFGCRSTFFFSAIVSFFRFWIFSIACMYTFSFALFQARGGGRSWGGCLGSWRFFGWWSFLSRGWSFGFRWWWGWWSFSHNFRSCYCSGDCTACIFNHCATFFHRFFNLFLSFRTLNLNKVIFLPDYNISTHLFSLPFHPLSEPFSRPLSQLFLLHRLHFRPYLEQLFSWWRLLC